MMNINSIKAISAQLIEAVDTLVKKGYEVEAIGGIDGISRPTIFLRFNDRCQRAQQEGDAVCYIYGNNKNVSYRRWQMPVNRCRAVWECLP